MTENRYIPTRRGTKVFLSRKGQRDGAWNKQVLKIAGELDKPTKQVIEKLHNKGLNIEEITYILINTYYGNIMYYGILGIVKPIIPKPKIPKKKAAHRAGG